MQQALTHTLGSQPLKLACISQLLRSLSLVTSKLCWQDCAVNIGMLSCS